ncbi:hypothetical protein C7441_11574 [Pseudaminobacter salicylatoxidans]|uniref:DUF4148 domain-containing protein n=1 Tax=Pseudaminobacter salicylatoxidans TaxID=93369 RepID=A0A316BYF2_PSESE|nr:hypothetical protein [Pseudaminobacter salicylatoxidans]PWJ79464.1 hypothetical protein C7441_11574 [Pseudaminobacter salicylatoxidans]
MKKTVIALSALVLTTGIAAAQDAQAVRHDAAPASVVVNHPTNIDYSSNAAISSPAGATNQQERAQIIRQRADNR